MRKIRIWITATLIFALTTAGVFAVEVNGSPIEPDIYKIGTVKGNKVTYNDTFEKYGVEKPQSKDEWLDIASAMAGYVRRDKIKPTGDDGDEKGVYLIMGDKGGYHITPFIMFGDMKSEVKYTKDEETTAVKVIKKWNGKEVPVTMQLLKDGKVKDEVNLNGNWTYVWSDLEKGNYEVVEKSVPDGYETKTSQKGDTFIITNTKISTPSDTPKDTPEETDEPKLPQTGTVWGLVVVLVILGLCIYIFGWSQDE